MKRCAVHRVKVAYGDAPSQFGHVYYPSDDRQAGATDPRAPIMPVVLIHGGYWSTEFGLTIETAIARMITERGAMAWNVEYRRVGEDGGGWPNTGRDVIAALRSLDDLVPQALPDDVRDLVDWSSTAVVGHSAGGHLAVWATAQLGARTVSARLGLVVAQSAVLDLVAAGKAGRETVVALMGGDYAEAPDVYRRASPIELEPFDAHVVAIHGSLDRAIPVEASRAYVDAVTARGQSAEFIAVPDEGHDAFVDPRSVCIRQTLRVLGI